ncbi:MAG: thiol reductant ABC exporter subunit CydC, partial [Ktedonobacteraceae bacterium]|nr:thiol reductant ABC exporter subunit CydC [Ktedonobacteraceae bacterium]
MRVFMRLLTLLSPFRWWIALAIFLGCVTVASNIGLLGMAAYLIADAALVPLLVLLTVPVFIVRLMGIVRPAARYAERLVSHDGVFRLLARLRTWMYSRLEPRAPLHLLTHRSGDLLARLVADIDELQNLYLRVVSPIIVALAMSLFAFSLFSIFSSLLAWTALAFLLLAGLGLPLLTYLLARGLGRRQLALRAEQKAQIVDGVQGIQDILAYGRSEEQLKKISRLDQALGTLQRRMARVSGLQEALNDLLMNLALWVLLALAIPLVTAKAIDGVYLAVLALLILASFEAIQPLAPAFQLLEHSLAAGRRLFSVADTPLAVIERPDPLPVPAGRTMRDYSLQF